VTTEWRPIKATDSMTDFLEQCALVEVDAEGKELSVYRRGEGATVDLPEYMRLCIAVEVPDLIPAEVRATIEAALCSARADMAPHGELLAHRVAAIDVALAWLTQCRP
jgi:hypothetical protein